MISKTNSAFEKKVEKVIAKKIRPYLQDQGGDVTIKEIKDGNIWLTFDGRCKTCPSARYTLETVVEKELRLELKDKLGEVYLVTEVDKELISFAKKLLNTPNKKTNELARNLSK